MKLSDDELTSLLDFIVDHSCCPEPAGAWKLRDLARDRGIWPALPNRPSPPTHEVVGGHRLPKGWRKFNLAKTIKLAEELGIDWAEELELEENEVVSPRAIRALILKELT